MQARALSRQDCCALALSASFSPHHLHCLHILFYFYFSCPSWVYSVQRCQMLKRESLSARLTVARRECCSFSRTPSLTCDFPKLYRSARFLVFDQFANVVAEHQLEFPQYFEHPGYDFSSWLSHVAILTFNSQMAFA